MLHLKFNEETIYADDTEPSRFVYPMSGTIHVGIEDDEDGHVVGNFSAILVDAMGAVVEEDSLFDVFDTDSRTADYYLLYDHADEFREAVNRAAFDGNYPISLNLLILDRLVIEPEYRGIGLGLIALRTIISRLRAGVGVIAMKPFPLQFEGRRDGKVRGLDAYALPEEQSTQKLRNYYARLGFKQLPGTEFLIMNPEHIMPSLDELGDTSLVGAVYRMRTAPELLSDEDREILASWDGPEVSGDPDR